MSLTQENAADLHSKGQSRDDGMEKTYRFCQKHQSLKTTRRIS